MNEWIPISSGLLPDDKENVQVTFISCIDTKPYCDEFAYIENGKWYWTDGDIVKVKITAWKYNCEPYMGE